MLVGTNAADAVMRGGDYNEKFQAAPPAQDELGGGEIYLAATRLSLPRSPPRLDIEEGSMETSERRLLLRLAIISRPPPRPIPGFPVAWQMVAALTPGRILLWRTARGSNLPGQFIGSVRVADLLAAELVTVPDRRGRTLAVKFVQRHGPRVMLDVVAGFRPETELLVGSLTDVLLRR